MIYQPLPTPEEDEMPATEKYPWTDGQIEIAYQAATSHVDGFDRDDIREVLRGFREYGIEVSFPQYWVHQNYRDVWFVMRRDGTRQGDHVAQFDPSHPAAERAAIEEARRLNNGGA